MSNGRALLSSDEVNALMGIFETDKAMSVKKSNAGSSNKMTSLIHAHEKVAMDWGQMLSEALKRTVHVRFKQMRRLASESTLADDESMLLLVSRINEPLFLRSDVVLVHLLLEKALGGHLLPTILHRSLSDLDKQLGSVLFTRFCDALIHRWHHTSIEWELLRTPLPVKHPVELLFEVHVESLMPSTLGLVYDASAIDRHA